MDRTARRMRVVFTAALLLMPLAAHAIETIPALWKDYDPNQGEFKEEVIKQETRDGVMNRESYISAYVLGEEIRVYCRFSVKEGAVKAPGLLSMHGWMGAPNVIKEYVDDGWAVMAHDYCGKTRDRPQYTRYPEKLRHGNMDAKVCGPVRSTTLEGKEITDPRQTSDFIWYAIQRRVLSYLAQRKEVDPTRLGATGYSYGGTLIWHLGTDPRVKAVVAHFGIGYNEYYRNKQVWMYNNPYVEPPKSPGEEIYLAAISPEAYVPYMTAATLFLNGSNDHHGGHERGLESFKKFKPGVPWSFAIQARGHHDTEKIEHNAKFWLEKYVRGRDVTWPEHPKSEIRLDAEGVPELIITPASPDAGAQGGDVLRAEESMQLRPGVARHRERSAGQPVDRQDAGAERGGLCFRLRQHHLRHNHRSLDRFQRRYPCQARQRQSHRQALQRSSPPAATISAPGRTSPRSKGRKASKASAAPTTSAAPAPSNCTTRNGKHLRTHDYVSSSSAPSRKRSFLPAATTTPWRSKSPPPTNGRR